MENHHKRKPKKIARLLFVYFFVCNVGGFFCANFNTREIFEYHEFQLKTEMNACACACVCVCVQNLCDRKRYVKWVFICVSVYFYCLLSVLQYHRHHRRQFCFVDVNIALHISLNHHHSTLSLTCYVQCTVHLRTIESYIQNCTYSTRCCCFYSFHFVSFRGIHGNALFVSRHRVYCAHIFFSVLFVSPVKVIFINASIQFVSRFFALSLERRIERSRFFFTFCSKEMTNLCRWHQLGAHRFSSIVKCKQRQKRN